MYHKAPGLALGEVKLGNCQGPSFQRAPFFSIAVQQLICGIQRAGRLKAMTACRVQTVSPGLQEHYIGLLTLLVLAPLLLQPGHH